MTSEIVYRAMLQHQGLSVEDLATYLSLSTDDIRAALDVLFELHLLQESSERPGHLFAVDPVVGLQEMLAREQQHLVERERQIASSRELIAQMLAESEHRTVRGRPGEEEGIERLDGMQAVQHRLEQLSVNASRSVMTFMPGGAQSGPALAAASRNDKQVLDRGVAIRTIALDSVGGDPATLEYARTLTANGGEFRTTTTLPPRMVLVDNSIALLPIDPADSRKGALCLTRSGVIASLVALFERTWEAAVPLGTDRDGLSEQDRALLLLIAQGHTDESAASQLFISTRTSRRIMASIMERLGARSRFEAGVKAAQRGWL